jgi:hypothetical protein
MIVGLAQAPTLLNSLGPEFNRPSWTFPFEMIPLCAVGLLFVLGMQARRARLSEQKWQRPSWLQNPFNYRQPVLFFDAMSYYMLAAGLGCALLGLSRAPASWAWELIFSIGAGLWIGVRLCLYSLAASFAPPFKSG